MHDSPAPAATIAPLAYDALPGWADDDHGAALRAFRLGAAVPGEHAPRKRPFPVDLKALARALTRAAAMPEDFGGEAARAFFEREFDLFEVLPQGSGFFTGYYEPTVEGSRTRTARFTVPLYRAPDDLIEIDPDDPPPGIERGFRFARRLGDGLAPYPDRGEIEAGFLAGRGLELAFIGDPVDAFFIHVQGAARVRLPDGGTLRVTYAAKSGHAYTAIGKVLVERGALSPDRAAMAGIRVWLAGHPAEAASVMATNRSFIFFREAPVADPSLGPVAAGKVPLTPGRSLAVDRHLHGFHLPIWVETRLPDGSRFRRLLIAQDTGSAIVGPARGDIFFGSGAAAGAIAGAMRAAGRFVVLVPRGSAG